MAPFVVPVSAARARKRINRTPFNSNQVGFALPADRQHPDVLPLTLRHRLHRHGRPHVATHIDTPEDAPNPSWIRHRERYGNEARRPPSVMADEFCSAGVLLRRPLGPWLG